MRYLLAFLLVPSLVWAQDWTAGQTADSIDGTYMNQSNTQNNYGGFTLLRVRSPGGATDNFLIRPSNDGRTGGYTDDSGKVYVSWASGGDPNASNESVWVSIYVMAKDWGEGTKTGATAGDGECSYDSAKHGPTTPVDWATDGANGSGDRSLTKLGWTVIGGDGLLDSDEFSWSFDGQYIDDIVTYGLCFVIDSSVNHGGGQVLFHSDDATTAADRPRMEFWETAPPSGEILGAGVRIGP